MIYATFYEITEKENLQINLSNSDTNSRKWMEKAD